MSAASDTSAHVAEIHRLLHAVPPRYSDWGLVKTLAFKAAARAAWDAIEAKKPSAQKIERAARNFRQEFET